MVLAVCILGDGDGEAVRYNDEMLGCAEVHVVDVEEETLGEGAGRRGRTGGLMLVGHGRSFSGEPGDRVVQTNVVRKWFGRGQVYVYLIAEGSRKARVWTTERRTSGMGDVEDAGGSTQIWPNL